MPLTGSGDDGRRSHSSSSWLQALKCSRLSARNSSAYCDRSMRDYPSTRWTASSTRDGWNGLTTKSLAPAWMASTTSACWPMALHIRILASGSCLTISRTASMPPMSGITMSMVTRSGLSWRYFSTACVPVSASPTTSNPACARMSVIIVRMKMASSQTRTVWLTARSLSSQNRAQQRRYVQHDEQPTPHSLFAVAAPHGAHQRGIDAGETTAIFQRGVPHRHHVRHLVHRKTDQLLPVPSFPPFTAGLELEDECRTSNFRRVGRGRCCLGGLRRSGVGKTGLWLAPPPACPQRAPPFHDRHQRAADIHEPRHDRGRSRDTRRWETRENLPHLIHLGCARQCSHAEQQQAGGDEADFSHQMRRSQDTARGCAEQANLRRLPRRPRRARGASPPAIPTRAAAARPSPDARTTTPPRATAAAARAPRDARLRRAPKVSRAGCRRTHTRDRRRSGSRRARGARESDASAQCRGARAAGRCAQIAPPGSRA